MNIKKELSKSEYSEIDTLLTNIKRNRSPYEIYSYNDLSEVSYYQTLKNEKSEIIKYFLINLLIYIENQTERYNKNNIAFTVLIGLLRKNQQYTEAEWIQYFLQVRQCVTNYNGMIKTKEYASEADRTDDLFYYSDFGIHYAVKQLQRTIKDTQPTTELADFITDLLDWDGFKTIRSSNAMGYTVNKTPILKAFKSLYDIVQLKSSDHSVTTEQDENNATFIQDKKMLEALITKIKTTKKIRNPNDLKGIPEFEAFKNQSNLKQYVSPLIAVIEKNGVLARENTIDDYEGSFSDTEAFEKHLAQEEVAEHYFQQRQIGLDVLASMLRKNLHFTEQEWLNTLAQIIGCIEQINQAKSQFGDPEYLGSTYGVSLFQFPLNYLIQQLERFLKKNTLSQDVEKAITQLLSTQDFENRGFGNDMHKAQQKLEAILRMPKLAESNAEVHKPIKNSTPQKQTDAEKSIVYYQLKTEDIGVSINELIKNSEFYHTQALHQLLILADTVNGARPSKKFLREVEENIAVIGRDSYRKLAHKMLTIIANTEFQEIANDWGGVRIQYLSDPSKQFVKGLVWTMTGFSDKETIQLLSKILEKSYTKIPELGPASAGTGNACVYVLGNMRGKDGLGALSRAKLKLQQNNIKKLIDKQLEAGAKKYGVSVDELAEMAVPEFGLMV